MHQFMLLRYVFCRYFILKNTSLPPCSLYGHFWHQIAHKLMVKHPSGGFINQWVMSHSLFILYYSKHTVNMATASVLPFEIQYFITCGRCSYFPCLTSGSLHSVSRFSLALPPFFQISAEYSIIFSLTSYKRVIYLLPYL